MGILSTNYAKKLLSIRKMEGLTQMRFSALTGISLSMIRNYETGQKPARAEVMEKVLRTEMFKKYTMWLLHDEEISMNDQVTPTLRQPESDILKVDKTTKDILVEIPLSKSSLHSIMNNISKLNSDELTKLSTVISRRGALFLLDLLEPENQSLLNLPENKKRAALRLESMGEEQFREILSKIEGNTDLSQEEMNVFTKKTAG